MGNGNYIVINGKKAELTEEQLKALGIEVLKKSVFDKAGKDNMYYFIQSNGAVVDDSDIGHPTDVVRYSIANYCTDANLMKQRALHEILARLLWRFSMRHDGDQIDWQNPISSKAYIYYDYQAKKWSITTTLRFRDIGQIYFYTRDIAKLAIEEIIKPFMAKHPELRW